MRKKTIKINANFEWEIDQRDWTELKLHQKTVEKDIQNKFEYDPTFVFHMLNDISDPNLKGLKLNGITKKVKL
jgi:carotenoid cleavage dioxygenase-like enzyme